MSNLHKVFVSYHHALDESYRKIFELHFGSAFDAIVPGSVNDGDIDSSLPTETIREKICDEYLRSTSVTAVLVGAQTWQRKHVDWEIRSSLRDTRASPRSGLLGSLLPTYPRAVASKHNPRTIPPPLYDNIQCGFASIHNWSEDATQGWLHEAFLRRGRELPSNARDSFGRNRTGHEWTD